MRELSIRFGGIVALDGVSFDVPDGSIVGLIGPNGAGKTTLFNCITRLYRPQSGAIDFEGESLLDEAPHRVVRRGIARTFQNVEVFPRLTALQNVMVGLHSSHTSQPLLFLGAACGLPAARGREREVRRLALEALAYVGLEARASEPVAGMSFGTLKAVELARAIVARPKLLLLDEPAGGLNHDEVTDLAGLIRRIHEEQRLSVLVVEHHMNLVMRVSHRVVCLDFGRKIADGPPDQVQNDPRVIEAYLGTPDDGAA